MTDVSNSGFLSPQKRELLNLVLARRGIQARAAEDRIPARPQSDACRLSFSQQRLWILDRLQPGLAAYNIPAAFLLAGRLDIAALNRSFNRILQRHSVLRASFRDGRSEPSQSFPALAERAIPVTDLEDVEELLRESTARELCGKEARRPFDLSSDALIRARLIRLSGERHILAITMHHIVSDAWSVGIFIQELASLYRNDVLGLEADLAPLPIQYSDFAQWQRESMRGEAFEKLLEFWQGTLGGDIAPIDLPIDRMRPRVQAFQGDTQAFSLQQSLRKRLKELSLRSGATLFMLLLAAFKTLLYRFTGNRDLLVGTPIAGRTRAELEPLIGFFANTLVLRSQASPQMSFEEFLLDVKASSLDAFAHQDMPFEKLVEALQPERRLSHSPLFQVMFALQNVPQQEIEAPGLVMSRVNVRNGGAKFDLSLFMMEAEDGILGSFEYDTQLFERTTMERIAQQFEVLLESAAQSPSTALGRLNLLSRQERQAILVDRQGVEAPGPLPLIDDALTEQARCAGQADAIRGPGDVLSFSQLDRQADALARHLASIGVGLESRVGIFLQRSPQMAIALFAISRAGGAYVPLDPSAPEKRTAFQIEDASIRVVVTSQGLRSALPSSVVAVTQADADAGVEGLVESDLQGRGVGIRPRLDNLAYVLYTSGSTGRPKGVEVTHRGLSNYLFNWCLSAYAVSDGQGAPLHTSLGFDLTITSLLGPLLAGRPVRLAPQGEGIDGLAGLLTGDPDFSLIKLTPAHLEALHHQLDGEPLERTARALVVGGEPLSPQAVAAWKKRSPSTRIFNEYGPTETVVGCSVFEALGEMGDSDLVPIGRPIPNCRIYLLDTELEPVPLGARGEICIGGPGVARGYSGRPSLTADRFIPDRFSRDSGDRLYRSGDLGRFGPDGNLVFLGRLDQQIKLRGFRIEPGEIEAALRRHPAVEEAIVCPLPSALRSERLAAYLLPSAGSQPEAAGLREYLKEWLPAYMIPATLTLVDAFPLTENGKIDRPALTESAGTVPERLTQYAAPRTQAEEVLASIWQEVLEVERIGRDDDFFHLGGHSLLAIQVASRVREAFEIELPLRVLFETPSISSLAQRIASRELERDAPALERSDRSSPIPLSFAQQRLWFLHQLSKDDPSYNIPYALRLKGELRIDVLSRAIDEIVRRHEILRTRFPTVNGLPRQEIAPAQASAIPIIDLRGLDRDRRESAGHRIAQEEVLHPFDLTAGPMLRTTLLRIDRDEHIGLLVMHHIVSDAWSTDLFVRELLALYSALAAGKASPLPEPGLQYADFAIWQRNWLTQAEASEHIRQWKSLLGESPPVLQLPVDRPRRPARSSLGGRVSHSFPTELFGRLKALSRSQGVTQFMTAMAAVQVVLHRYSGQDRFIVGTPLAERPDRRLEESIGMFLNTLPVPADFAGDPSLEELLQRVRRLSLEAFSRQQLPFERLVEAFQAERDLTNTPLIQVMLSFQQASPQVFELPGVEVRSLEIGTDTARFDITFFFIDAGEELIAQAEYHAELFDASTIRRLFGHLQRVMEAMADDLGQPVRSVQLLSPAESNQLLHDWNDTRSELGRDACLHQLIEENARRRPSDSAVEHEGGRLTYGELDRRANQLARFLRSRGIVPEVPVAICVDRSPWMLVGILAILKAGGVYVPLDPAYPIERLAHMLRDSSAKLILTQQPLLGRLPESGLETICLDSEWDARITPQQDAPVEDLSVADNLAYIIYTSGSTGRPKGTMASHRSVINHGLAMGRIYGLNHRSRFSQFFSLSFDGSVEDLFPPLLAGSALLCHPNPTRHTLKEVLSFYEERGISVLHLPTALWHYFAAELRKGEIQLPPTVRVTSAGGEALAMDKLREYFADTGGNVPFVNLYGPTETTVTSSVVKARGHDWSDFPGRNLPIGRPLANVDMYVLDRNLELLPVGVPGELHIGGVCVTRGYLDRPALTAEKFIPHPFSAQPGARFYKSGDLVRYLPDGTLDFLNRIDKQVKVRGFRIELAEIEAALVEHPAIADAVVDVKDYGENDLRIVAYLIPSGGEPEPAEIRKHLERFLPAFMIPSASVSLDRFPLTENGKIDRAKLPLPEYASQSSQAFVPPRTPLERRIAHIWKEVLQVEQVGVEDNFFELGGHSLLAVRIHELLVAQLHREIPLVRLFEFSTIASLARFLSQEESEAREEVELGQSDEWARRRKAALKRQRAARRSRATVSAEAGPPQAETQP